LGRERTEIQLRDKRAQTSGVDKTGSLGGERTDTVCTACQTARIGGTPTRLDSFSFCEANESGHDAPPGSEPALKKPISVKKKNSRQSVI